MTTYVIKKVAENQWGLYDTDITPPYDLIVLGSPMELLEQIKKDFIKSDKALAKRKKKWKKRAERGS